MIFAPGLRDRSSRQLVVLLISKVWAFWHNEFRRKRNNIIWIYMFRNTYLHDCDGIVNFCNCWSCWVDTMKYDDNTCTGELLMAKTLLCASLSLVFLPKAAWTLFLIVFFFGQTGVPIYSSDWTANYINCYGFLLRSFDTHSIRPSWPRSPLLNERSFSYGNWRWLH